ncbi:MAG: hypothetical protein IJD79_01810 [Clostridia bacterium]|nr:hypothetical protein [Clostridia bacterium]
MKLYSKRIFAVFLSVLMVFACGIIATADDGGTKVLFTVESADGAVTEYGETDSFSKVVESLPDGSIVTLCANVYMGSGVYLDSDADHPKEITIDLAGYGLYSTSKSSVPTMFGVQRNVTLNVTSSKPEAFLYMIDEATKSTQGGCIFSVTGEGGLINLGGTVSLKGETYPGSNISTFSSCFVDIRGKGTVGFNGDGGQHFANIADWMGFINPRNGDGVITLKNADILVDANNNLIHSEDPETSLYLENCLIFRLDGTSKYLFNQVQANIYMKNCKTNYSLVAQNGAGTNLVTLEGENIFGAGFGFDSNLLVDGEGKTPARTSLKCELVQGGVDYWRYDNSGRFNKLQESITDFGDAFVFVPRSETFKCTWQYDGNEKEELWQVGVDPEPPFEISPTGTDGLYKKGWLKTEINEEGVVYKSTYIVDFNPKVQGEYTDDAFCYHIFVPAFIIDDGFISYAEGMIGGSGFTAKDWSEAEIDGEKYYEYITMNIAEDDIDEIFEIYIPCDIIDGKKPVAAEGMWRINLSKYLDIVYANAEKYTDEQMELVEEVKNRYLPLYGVPA